MSRDRNHGAKNPRRELLITDVPTELRQALEVEAQDTEVSINEAAVRILAAHYKVKHVTPENGLRGQAARTTNSFARNPDAGKLTIRGGAKLHRKIGVDAARRDGTLRGVVLECLSLHFNLEPEPIGRRPRQPKEANA